MPRPAHPQHLRQRGAGGLGCSSPDHRQRRFVREKMLALLLGSRPLIAYASASEPTQPAQCNTNPMAAFPINRSSVELKGLQQDKHATDPTTCAKACCSDDGCSTWQFGTATGGASHGCWRGDGVPIRKDSTWIGGSRPPAPTPAPPPTPPPPPFHFTVDWSSGGANTTFPTSNFSVRKMEAIYYPPDGRIYAYADIVNCKRAISRLCRHFFSPSFPVPCVRLQSPLPSLLLIGGWCILITGRLHQLVISRHCRPSRPGWRMGWRRHCLPWCCCCSRWVSPSRLLW